MFSLFISFVKEKGSFFPFFSLTVSLGVINGIAPPFFFAVSMTFLRSSTEKLGRAPSCSTTTTEAGLLCFSPIFSLTNFFSSENDFLNDSHLVLPPYMTEKIRCLFFFFSRTFFIILSASRMNFSDFGGVATTRMSVPATKNFSTEYSSNFFPFSSRKHFGVLPPILLLFPAERIIPATMIFMCFSAFPFLDFSIYDFPVI